MRLQRPAAAEENPLEAVEVPEPEPGPGEVRLRVRACGVCRTDLHTVEGEIHPPRLPVIPGHQIVGVVDAAGPGVTRFAAGARAGVPWLYDTCGTCAYCARGAENLCEAARFTGFSVNGGYAEAMVARADFTYPLPPGVPEAQAAPLLCAGVIGYRALRLSEIRPGGRLGLYGFGNSAHIAIQVARHWGCEVFVMTRGEAHQALARELGAAWVGAAADPPPAPLDSAVIFAPAGPLVLNALRALRKGGTVALAGIYMTPIPELDYGSLLYHEKTLRSVANSTRQDAEELLQLAAAIPIQTSVQPFRLDEANRALQLLKQDRIRGAAVLAVEEP
jgi:propanol-preferring alcohol dehydrogenase